MPNIESKFPENIFHLAIKGEFLRIAHSNLYLRDFIPMTKEILKRMKQQGSGRNTTGNSFKILAYPGSFLHVSISYQDLLSIFSEDKLSDFSLSEFLFFTFLFLYACP